MEKPPMMFKLIVLIVLIIFYTVTLLLISSYSDDYKINFSHFDELEKIYDSGIDGTLFETKDYSVIRKVRRYAKSFTQGLFMDGDDTIVESSGLYKKSRLSKFFVDSPDARMFNIYVDSHKSAGGACRLGDKIYQLTWRDKEILVYNYKNDTYVEFAHVLMLPDEIKEGWGVTSIRDELVISDGTDQLYFTQIDVNGIKINRVLTVVDSRGIFDKEFLNMADLESVDGLIYANVWYTHSIVIINSNDGNIIRDIDFSKLIKFENLIKNSEEKLNVLNGIAYDRKTKGFWITGKEWSHLYLIKLKNVN